MDFNAGALNERLQSEDQDYWIHLNVSAAEVDKYPAKQHAKTVAAQLAVSEGLIYLPGQPSRIREDSDLPVPFRQRRYFYYLSGVDEPDCALTYDIETEFLALYLPPIDPRTYIWNGKVLTLEGAKAKYDVDDVRRSGPLYDSGSRIWQDIYTWMSKTQGQCTIYCLHPNQEPYRCKCANSTLLQPAMDRARVRKDPHEIELIRKANAVTAAAHRDVLRKVSKFRNETEIQATFLDACVTRDAKHQAYGIIAASGANNSILHYVDNDQTLVGKQLALLDAGCEWDCYASDVTRTFPISGSWPSTEAKAIYDLVELMQSTCIGRLKPGVRYLDLHYLAQRMAIKGLLQLGILHEGTAEEIFEARTVLAFFPHGLGHHLGLEVHDVSNVPLMASKQHDEVMGVFGVPNTRPYMAPCTVDSPLLEEGMVVTVEPGIYFNSYALNYIYLPSPVHSKYINLDVLKRYMPVGGVRIEDDILITHDGYENLTTAPKGEEMLCLIGGKDLQVRGNVTTKHNENRASMITNNEKISYCFELDESTNSFERVKKISSKENLRRATELLKKLDFNPALISPTELDISKISAHIHRALLNRSTKSKSPLLRDQVRIQQLLTILTIEPFTFNPGELDYHHLVDKLLWQISCHVRDTDRTKQQRGIRQDGSDSVTGVSSGSSNLTKDEEEGGTPLNEQNSNTHAVELIHQHPAPNPSSSNPKLKEYEHSLNELKLQNARRKQIAKAEQREQEALNNINKRLLQLSASSTTISKELATISAPPLNNPISNTTTASSFQHATNTDTERYKQQLRMLERMSTVHYKRALNEVKRVGGVEPGGVKPVKPGG